jgi:Lrp/AsnC family transcriptional regulator for asnA, asnC and gidA
MLFINPQNNRGLTVNLQPKLDNIDVEILKTMLIDARTSFAKIARKCDVSTNTIVNRFNRLKKIGVITGTRLLLTPHQTVGMSMGINLVPEFEEELNKILNSLPDVKIFYPEIGTYDIHVTVFAKNNQELDKIKDQIKKCKGIKKIDASLWTSNKNFYLENLAIRPNEDSKNGQN